MSDTERWIEGLLRPEAFEHAVSELSLVETHISWVVLTGPYAYKVKKPVDLGFCDFTTHELRRHFCEEEIRLNRRLAPDLYVEVVPITGSERVPRVRGSGPPFEHAVKMVQFPADALLDGVLERGGLEAAALDELARVIATFHEHAARSDPTDPHGRPEGILERVEQNFVNLRRLALPHAGGGAPGIAGLLAGFEERRDRLERWSHETHRALSDVFRRRKREGRVRECHGDLHLANMALIDGEIRVFDGIEFNESFRWIDVASEITFLIMDLVHRRRADLAHRFLNRYLDASGDHDLLLVLRYYLVYRALVRAMVAGLRTGQLGDDDAHEREKEEALRSCLEYVALAETFTESPRPALWITHGVSGSGKSTICRELSERSLALIHLRSDIERKRLFGLRPEAASPESRKREVYGQAATRRTYDALREKAATCLRAGFSPLIDATFLSRSRRDRFRELARSLGAPFGILRPLVSHAELEQRVIARERAGRDASEADRSVLRFQLSNQQALEPDELAETFDIDERAHGHGMDELFERMEIRTQERSRDTQREGS